MLPFFFFWVLTLHFNEGPIRISILKIIIIIICNFDFEFDYNNVEEVKYSIFLGG